MFHKANTRFNVVLTNQTRGAGNNICYKNEIKTNKQHNFPPPGTNNEDINKGINIINLSTVPLIQMQRSKGLSLCLTPSWLDSSKLEQDLRVFVCQLRLQETQANGILLNKHDASEEDYTVNQSLS